MASRNLLKRIRAELRREGKKTLALGLLLMVGGYFWVPPLWHKFFPSPDDAAAEPSAKPPATAEAKPKTDAQTGSEDRVDWRVRRRRLDNMAILKPADWDDHLRDPFSRDWIDQGLQAKQKSKDAGPKDALLKSLVVSSTMVGGRVRAAIINDRIYRKGDWFPSHDKPICRIKEILPDQVILEQDGNQIRVPLNKGKESSS